MKTSSKLWASHRRFLNPSAKNGKAKQVCYNYKPVEPRETGAIVCDNNPKHSTTASMEWFIQFDWTGAVLERRIAKYLQNIGRKKIAKCPKVVEASPNWL